MSKKMTYNISGDLMNRIKDLRAAQHPKMSQEKLGQMVGVGRSTVAMWESGSSEPDNATLIKLAEIFCVSVDYLLGRDEKKPTPEIEDGQCLLEKRLNEFLAQATDETKQALLVLLEQLQKP